MDKKQLMTLTAGELKMVEHAREHAQTLRRLLSNEIKPEDIHEALRTADKIVAVLQYFKLRTTPKPSINHHD